MRHRNNFFKIDRFFDFDDDLFPSIFTRGASTPKMEIFENESDVIAKAELPGLSKEDISIDLKDSVLTISGEKKVGDIEPGVRFHRTEIAYGSFERSFELGYDIDAEKIEATFENGVLTITLPKVAPQDNKTSIEIR